jgi:hypothetical protein
VTEATDVAFPYVASAKDDRSKREMVARLPSPRVLVCCMVSRLEEND